MKILVIPMDDRPCTYNFPLQIGKIYGAEIISPPKEKMGNLKRIADRAWIIKWIKENSNDIDGLVIASDTLAYGGLIPSRRNYDSFEKVADNLKIIIDIKKNNPDLSIYVCSTILRISNSNENQEEKEYWKDYGETIHKYSFLCDKNYLINEGNYDQYNIESILNINTKNEEIRSLREKIPDNILKDYIDGRLRNFKVNKLLIKWLKEGYIDYLSICADDSSQYGFNVLEKKIFNHIVEVTPKIQGKINVYPGADESISSLVAGLINRKNNFKPSFYPVYSQYSKGNSLITMYEGIPLKSTLQNQISVINGEIVKDIEMADIILYIYTSENSQEDHYLKSAYNQEITSVSDKIKSEYKEYLKSPHSKPKVLIDLAYANGADHSFISDLIKDYNIKDLLSFSSWNTTGNSIGTALSHSSLAYSGKILKTLSEKEHYKFLIERFFDDWVYQGLSRLKYVSKNGYNLNESQLQELKQLYESDLNHYIDTNPNFKDIKIKEIYFPWDRPFEVSVNID